MDGASGFEGWSISVENLGESTAQLLSKQANKKGTTPRGGGRHFLGKTIAEGAAFSLFLPVHPLLLLNPSLHERVIILGKVFKEKGGGLRFVAGE
jgi:hypothetical protein